MSSNPPLLNAFAPEEQPACFLVLNMSSRNQIAFLIIFFFAQKRRCAAVKKWPRRTLAEDFMPLLLHTIMEL